MLSSCMMRLAGIALHLSPAAMRVGAGVEVGVVMGTLCKLYGKHTHTVA